MSQKVREPTVFSLSYTPTATGTGTAETSGQNITVPANVVEMVATRGDVTATNGDPAESICGVFKLKGDNWQNNPYEWFAEIGSAKLGAIDQVGYDMEPRWWKANLPVTPNSVITLTYEPLDALANNGMYTVEIRWSTARTGLPPIKRKCSREVATTTTADASITLTDMQRIEAIYFGVAPSTVAADDPLDARLTLESSALEEQQTLQVHTVIHTIEATTGVAKTALRASPQSIRRLPDASQATFSATLTITTNLTNAGAWFYAIEYIPKSVQVTT